MRFNWQDSFVAVSPPSIGKGIALSAFCLLLLGIMPIVANLRSQTIDALSFSFALSVWQVVLALPIFGMELRLGTRGIFESRMTPRTRRRTLGVAVLTGAMFGLATYMYVLGVERAGAGTAAVAIQAYPVFAIIWESLFLKRRKTPMELLLTGLMIAALCYLGTGGTFQLAGMSPWFLVALGVPFLWSIAHVIIKEELGQTSITPVQVTFFRVAISTAFLLVMVTFLAPHGLTTGVAAILQPMSALMGLVYLLELIVWFYAVRHIDVSLASSITTPWPALTMILAVPLLGDGIAPYQLVALLIVVACIYALALTRLRKTA
ncbi:MAG: DMT family transporter [Hyphomicrobiales bacterium]